MHDNKVGANPVHHVIPATLVGKRDGLALPPPSEFLIVVDTDSNCRQITQGPATHHCRVTMRGKQRAIALHRAVQQNDKTSDKRPVRRLVQQERCRAELNQSPANRRVFTGLIRRKLCVYIMARCYGGGSGDPHVQTLNLFIHRDNCDKIT